MPKAKAGNVLARQLSMLRLIPDRPVGKTARQLTEEIAEQGYVVDVRTVTRDLNSISTLLPLVRNDKGIPHGWHWRKGAHLDIPALDITDALSLSLLEHYLKPLLPDSVVSVLAPRFAEANRKLAQLSGANRVADWADKIRVVPPTLPLQAPKIREGILGAVQDALLRELQIECGYRSADGRTTIQRLHPLALVQRGPVTYLVATAFAYQDAHLYALHRFQKVAITEDAAERPDDFDIDAYIASGGLQFGNGKTLRLKARIDENLANVLTETPLSVDMQIKARCDECILTATVADSWQLRWWLLSWGAAVEVVGPKGLRDEIAHDIRRMHILYRQ